MYNCNRNLHFIGIGGIGMAGIAEVLLNLGYAISGSDLRSSALTEHLAELGAKVFVGHAADNITRDTDVVIISSAVGPDNIELIEARKRNIPVIPRAEMLAELMRMKYGVAVAGSHGKTTTTSMIAKLISDIGLDPTVIIGGRVLTQTTGARLGTGQYLVAEADESDGSFCLLRPAIAVVTNIDVEHLTHYGSFGALEEAFLSFMSSVPFYGVVIACADDPIVARLSRSLKRRVVTYGLSPEHDISACEISLRGPLSEYNLCLHGQCEHRVHLPMSGRHMVSNSLAAIAVALELGGLPEEACKSLRTFPGVSRRCEIVAEHDGILIVDDYAHHPTEIKATLGALKHSWLPYQQQKTGASQLGRLFVLFQPHRYTRTKELFSEFLRTFDDADILFLSEIYSAGEPPLSGITGEALAKAMQHPSCTFCADLKETLPKIVPQLRRGDIVATIGAGSVTKTAPELARILASR